MKKLFLLVMVFSLYVSTVAHAAELNVYTAIEPDVLALYEKAFKKQHPDIKINWVRDSAGPITARLLAEKDNPKADVALGLSVYSMVDMAKAGMFQPYRPASYDNLNANMRDNRPEPLWIGLTAWASAICVNKKILDAEKLPVPQSWEDLLRPEYKGKIIMPNPASSGTGYMIISGWINIMGEEKAWAFMQELHKNIKMYVHSGSKPAQMAAQGEVLIGLSADAYGFPYVKRKAPLLVIDPADGIPWDMEVSAIVKGAKNLDAAKKLIDFTTSSAIADIAIEHLYIPSLKVDSDKVRDVSKLLDVDFNQASAQRTAVIEKWRATFGN